MRVGIAGRKKKLQVHSETKHSAKVSAHKNKSGVYTKNKTRESEKWIQVCAQLIRKDYCISDNLCGDQSVDLRL